MIFLIQYDRKAGNLVKISEFKDKDKIKSIILAILTVAAMPLVYFGVFTLLVAEWISLFVIGVHFVLSTIDMDKPVNIHKPKKLSKPN